MAAAAFLCMLAGEPAFAQQAETTSEENVVYDTVNGYSLAFVDADVKRVVDAVLGSMLGENYSIDPEVTGTITLRTARPVAEESLIPLLERALGSVEAVLVRRPDGYRVVSRKSARGQSGFVESSVTASDSGERQFAPSPPGYASEVVALQHASAVSLAELITEFLGPDIATAARDGSNGIIITGSADERDAAKRLVARFDVDTLAAMQFEIFRLETVDADTIVAELDQIFQPPYDILGSRVRIVALPRLRSILAIAADRNDLARIEPWVRRLDTGVSGKRKLYNYAVQNGRAADIAASLQAVLSGSGVIAPAIGLSSEGSSREVTDGRDLDEAFEPSARRRPDPTPVSAVGSEGGAGPRIVPNAQNNSLLIYADGEEYAFIREALEKLDQPVAQVLIEATLAEVTLTDDLRYGVDFSILEGSGTQTAITNSSNSGGSTSPIFPGFSVAVTGSSAAAVLNTIQSKTDVRVLSAPKLVTLNNEPATLQVGDQVPIITQQAQSTIDSGAPIVNNIELRDTGVILQVTPRVNDSGTIILDISQEVSDVAVTTSSGINSPTIQQRRLTSTVATRSGQMIALGGLIRNSQTKGRSGIPLLSQIPIIGGLFGTTTNTGSRTELIILLTPTVIRSEQETRDIVDALIDGLDLTRPQVDRALEAQVGGRIVPPPGE